MKPQIRFKGFTDDWERSKIGEIVQFGKGHGYSKSDLQDKGEPIVLYGHMYTQYTSVIKDIKHYATLKENSILSQGDEVIIPSSGETPEDISIASAIKLKNIIIGGDLNILKFKKQLIDPSFAAVAITNSPTHEELSKFAQGKTIVHLRNSDISKGHISYPNIEEQICLSKYFETIEEYTSTINKKISSLKQIKSACLQSMFPQEGESVPKVRFKGFNEEWNTISFSEAFEFLRNNSLSRAELAETGTVYNIHYGDILIKFGDCLFIEQDSDIPFIKDEKIANKLISSSLIKNGDIIFADAAEDYTVGKCIEVITNQDNKIVSGLHTIPCRPTLQFASGYLGYYLNSNIFHNQLVGMIQGSKVCSISKKGLRTTHLIYPKDLAEQQKIASYFENLDQQISLQTQRLEKLKQIKSACLDKMFV